MKTKLLTLRLLWLPAMVALLLLATAQPAGGEKADDLDYEDDYGDSLEDPIDEDAESESQPDSHIRGVLELDELTFDKVVGGKHSVLVEFYAPWCSHCKALVKEMAKTAANLAEDKGIFLAKVNAEDNKKLTEKFGIEGYPTLKFFPKGSTQGQEYDGDRTADAFLDFLKEGDKTGVVPKLEGLVKAFMHQASERKGLLSTTEEAVKELQGEDARFGAYYVKVMSRVVKEGPDYIPKERERLQRLMHAGGLKKEKEAEFKGRLNILKAFDVSEDEF